MIEIASLIIVNLVVAAIMGFIIGYLVGNRNSPTKLKSIENLDNKETSKEKVDIKPSSGINPIFKKNSTLDFKPLILSSPRPSGKDKLIKIKGINQKVEQDLNNLGIFHFDQIAKWSNKNGDWIDEFLLLPGYSKRFQWVEQAKILASGRETIYSQKVDNNEIVVD